MLKKLSKGEKEDEEEEDDEEKEKDEEEEKASTEKTTFEKYAERGLHITWGVDEIDTQIFQETLRNRENP